MDQHAVAVTEEAVTLLDRFLVCPEQVGSPTEGRDEHHQGRIWEVEVGQHSVHQPEFIGRVDEDVGPSRMPLIIFQGQAFQNPNHRGADSNDRFSFGFHLQKVVQHCFGNLEVFGMHPMFPQVRILDSTEGSKADMQGQFENPGSPFPECFEDLRGEV